MRTWENQILSLGDLEGGWGGALWEGKREERCLPAGFGFVRSLAKLSGPGPSDLHSVVN